MLFVKGEICSELVSYQVNKITLCEALLASVRVSGSAKNSRGHGTKFLNFWLDDLIDILKVKRYHLLC